MHGASSKACATERDTPIGEDSSRNVSWLAVMHFFKGENWHRNHHERPGFARLGRNWRQPDAGYAVICVLEGMGLVSEALGSRYLASE
jgi:fatty-acid desaturase